MSGDTEAYERQGFGAALQPQAPYGLLIVDLVNGFADPAVFGGGNIPEAIANTERLLAAARERGWPVAHSRIVFSDSGADSNVFTLKVPGMLTLKEADWNSAIVPQLSPREDELVVRKTVPSAFFGTVLAAWLTQRGVKTLLVAGSVTSGCVRASVVDAIQHGFVPLVVEDAVGDRAPEPHLANLGDLRTKYAEVVDEATAIAYLGGTT